MKAKSHWLVLWVVLLTGIVTLRAAELPYRDASLPIDQRVEDLLNRMTLDEKIGQMTLIEKNSITPADITRHFIGGLLSGGGGYPTPNTAENWAAMVDGFQARALETRLAIPLIYGADGVHGHNNLYGATIFPHNIGLGATRNPELVRAICAATAEEMMATGVYWNYAPMIAVPQDIRWGRTYEGYSEATAIVSALGSSCVKGMQGDTVQVLATPKHYLGDGATAWGSSAYEDYQIDQGVAMVDEITLREIHLPPYKAALDAGAMSIMITFSGWGETKVSSNQYLITNLLKGELGFQGFTVSDWGAIDQISPDYAEAVVSAINAGIDMNMVPYDAERFIATMQAAVADGRIPLGRIDDAVRRILRVKFMMGLFERPFSQPDLLETVGSAENRALARQAVAQSLVLLRNEAEALPLAKSVPTLFVAGVAADDIGIQSGGWTIEWQGKEGAITPGTTLLEGIEATVSAETTVIYDRLGRFRNARDSAGNLLNAEVGIVVVGERPYAEGRGDAADLSLSEPDRSLIERVRQRVDTLIVIVISGRPLIISEQLPLAEAWVAAWLPGSEGQGVADVLFGDQPFVGRLPYTWPRSMDQLPFDFATLAPDEPLFPFGYGLAGDS